MCVRDCAACNDARSEVHLLITQMLFDVHLWNVLNIRDLISRAKYM